MKNKIIVSVIFMLCIVSIQFAYAEPEFLFEFKFTERGDRLDYPTDVILDDRGNKIYVVDRNNHRISVFDDEGNHENNYGKLCDIENNPDDCSTDAAQAVDNGDGEFNNPISITRNNSDKFFIVDSGNDRIQRFDDRDLRFEAKWNLTDTRDNKYFESVSGIAWYDSNPDKILVSGSSRGGPIIIFNENGDFQNEIPRDSFDDERFDGPTNMIIDNAKDRLYISDTGNNRIVIFELVRGSCPSDTDEVVDGVCFVDAFGSSGDDEGEFSAPRGLAFDSTNDLLYVADSDNDRIQVFEIVDGNTCPRGTEEVIDGICFVEEFGKRGTGDGNFNTPIGIALDPENEKLFVADANNDRIQVFSLTESSSSSSSSSNLPAKPSNLKALPISKTAIVLVWEEPTQSRNTAAISGYGIEYKSGSENYVTIIENTESTATSFIHDGLDENTKYTYRVYSINSQGESNKATAATVQPADTNTPNALTATAISPTQIRLTWLPPSNTFGQMINGYEIVKVFSNGRTTVLAETNSDTLTFVVTNLTTGTSYTYEVNAQVGSGTTTSNEATATPRSDSDGDTYVKPTTVTIIPKTEPSSPTRLTATATSPTQIKLVWNLPSDDGNSSITGYKIEVKEGNNSYLTLVEDTDSAVREYTHANRIADTKYTYKVSAINSIGTSDASNEASATPKPPIIQITSINTKEIDVDRTLSFTVKLASNSVVNNVIFSLEGNVPAEAKITSRGGAFSWTPDDSNAGKTYTFDIVAKRNDLVDIESVTVKVNDVEVVQPTTTSSSSSSTTTSTPPVEPPPKPKELGIAVFVDPALDLQSYVDRYNNEPEYKAWFDENFPEYDSIYQAVGLVAPVPLAVFVDPALDPQSYVDRYNNEPTYKAWFDENFPEYDSIYQAVGLVAPVPLAVFVDPALDPQSYVDRYNNEPTYKAWFDENFPEYDSIYQAVGLVAPVPLAVFVDPALDPQSYVDRYNNEPTYKAWFDENFPEYDSIYQAVGLVDPAADSMVKVGTMSGAGDDGTTAADSAKTGKKIGICGPGTKLIEGVCTIVIEIPETKSIWQWW